MEFINGYWCEIIGFFKIVEEVVLVEYVCWFNMFIYFIGDLFGGFFFLVVVVWNFELDFVLVFVNLGVLYDIIFILFFC